MMKKGEIVLLVMAVIGVLLFSACTTGTNTEPVKNPIVNAQGCDWRAPAGNEFPFGSCEAVVGAYFDGANCINLAGCPNEAQGKIPFTSLEQCVDVCQENNKVTGSAVKEFKIETKQFVFVPETITVKKGDKVRLVVTSTDVEHGIGILEFDVSLKVPKGETRSVEFVADKAGTYTMYCNVFCGNDHKKMKGTLVVE
ncbi:MAG TPA: cupredoxin domain-containing protein [Candidatus Nanoarchaeia archaeon]|nr:cupredoxin domain-containing protein [Candidatus Nanoarchaeia archaeon]